MRTLDLFAVLSIFLLATACQPEPAPAPAPEQFTLLPASATGIDFANTLTEAPNTNILVYEYFYNGGGVATGDFNADGLADLYFTSNMGVNRLYLNTGNLQFRDITAQSGAGGRPGPWKTGVAVADINADGLPDIYLSYSGMLPPEKRRNQLFINQGNSSSGSPTFKEEAARYGLDLPAFTNQAYFFDYDGDDDLDVLILNHNPKSLPILHVEKTRELLATPDPERGLRLLQNNGGRFSDVTEAAGINGSPLSYGLGLALSDLNGDGLTDFYVSNDYEVPDYLYLNNGDGTFTDRLGEQIGHTSHFSMGSDVADVNNDGLPDIFTLDMLPADNRRRKLLMADDNRSKHQLNLASGFHAQTMRNMLQLNRGDGTFAETGQLAGVAATDWSWSALLTDLDNDGWKDLHVTNGYVRDYTNQDFIKYMEDFVAEKGRLQRADVLDLLQEMPASEVSNYAFRNRGNGVFDDATAAWGLRRPSNSNGAISVDLDQDGDLDLVVNNLNQPAFIYENNGNDRHYLQVQLAGSKGNPDAIGARVTIETDSLIQTQELFPARGYLSSGPTLLHFGLGADTQVRRITVRWPDQRVQVLEEVPSDQLITLSHSNAGSPVVEAAAVDPLYLQVASPVEFTHVVGAPWDFDRQRLLPRNFSVCGPAMAAGDLDGDNLTDLFIGGGGGQPAAVYFQTSPGNYREGRSGELQATAMAVTSKVLLHDFNGDGFPDAYLANGGYHDFTLQSGELQDVIAVNDGSGNFTLDPGLLPILPVSTGAVAVSHHDREPTLLFVGGRIVPGSYPTTPPSYLLRQDAEGNFQDVTQAIAPTLENIGMVTDASWSDLNGDGNEELVIVGEWMPVTVYAKVGQEYVDRTGDFFPAPISGWWNVIRILDANGDGRPDLLVGNEGDNNLYGVGSSTPVTLYGSDRDGNGAVDPLLFYYNDGVSYPDANRDELLGQLGGLRSAYPSYAAYAGVTAQDLLQRVAHEETVLRATSLKTTLFLQDERGRLVASPLPREVQYAPVHTITELDADGDGQLDLLLCGNDLQAKLRSGRADANSGILLRGLGQGEYAYVPQPVSGFHLSGDVRSVVITGNTLLFGIAGREVQAYLAQTK